MTAVAGSGIRDTFAQAPRPVRAIMLGIFVNRLGSFLQAFLVLFLTHRGFTGVQAGVALGVYGGGAVVGLIVGGTLSDRLGVRRATLISMLGSAALLLAIRYATGYATIVVVVAAVGVVAQLYRPASSALLSRLTPKHQQVMIFAMYRLALNLGTTVAPIIGAALIAVNYSLLFWSEAVVCVLYAVIAAIALPRHDREDEHHADHPEPGTGGPGDAPEPGRRTGYRTLFGDRAYLVFLATAFINAAVYVQYVSVLPLAMGDAGYGIGWYGAMVSLNGFVVITCELLMTRLVQRWPIKAVVAAGFVLLAVGRTLYGLPWGITVFIAGTLVWTLAEIVGGPSVFAYPGLAAPKGFTGRYVGAMQAAFGLGTALGPAIGLWLYNTVGASVWWISGVACLVAMVGAWVSMRIPDDEPVADLPATTVPVTDPEHGEPALVSELDDVPAQAGAGNGTP